MSLSKDDVHLRKLFDMAENVNCIDCKSCVYCTNCKDCDSCNNCNNCVGCYKCEYCYGIIGGHNLYHVVFGVELTDVQYEQFMNNIKLTKNELVVKQILE